MNEMKSPIGLTDSDRAILLKIFPNLYPDPAQVAKEVKAVTLANRSEYRKKHRDRIHASKLRYEERKKAKLGHGAVHGTITVGA